MMTQLKAIFLAAAGVFLAAPSYAADAAAAEAPEVLGTFGEWTSFAEGNDKAKLCYAASAPIKKEGKYTSRGDTAVLVTHNLGDGSFDVVSVVAGYEFKPDEDVLAQVDATKFTMFTKGDRAWNAEGKDDREMVAAMKRGRNLLVIGNSTRGTRTTDTYSLTGFTKAYEAISKACPRPKAAKKK